MNQSPEQKFSMKDWRPELPQEKLGRLEQELHEIKAAKTPLVSEKISLESDISEMTHELKFGNILSKEDFLRKTNDRRLLITKKREIDAQLGIMSNKQREISREIKIIENKLKQKPKDAIAERLVPLRDKYLAFSSDTTRVSSMRAMASKFVEEIQALMNDIS